MSFIDQIMAYEDGELSELETLDLFAGLIRDGICWQLQGSYGRTAASLIDAGLISPEGDLLVLRQSATFTSGFVYAQRHGNPRGHPLRHRSRHAARVAGRRSRMDT
jgi:hypothetical protein